MKTAPCIRRLAATAFLSIVGFAADLSAVITITEQPQPRIVSTGGELTLQITAQATGTLKYQWKKNNANIAGATAAELSIAGVKLTHAGAYKCVLTETVNGKAASLTSSEVKVAVVDSTTKTLPIAAGVKTTLTAGAAGDGITYQWLKDAAPIAGATAKTFILATPQPADSGGYACQITSPGGVLATGATSLIFYDKPPVIQMAEGEALPNAIMSGTYAWPIPIDPDLDRTPATYAATGLPAGLKMNPTTGIISGKPSASKDAPYDVTLTATNAKGKSVVKVKLTVFPLPVGLVGSFMAGLSRFADLNDDLGGRLDLVITYTGAFTGKLVLGTISHAFKGNLDADIANPMIATGSATIIRRGLLPLTVAFTLDAESHSITIGEIGDTSAALEFNGWRNIWNKIAPATAFAGYYTFGLAMPDFADGESDFPQGYGYGSFTVASATGALSAVGKLADGTGYTTSSFVGPNGEIALFQALYAASRPGSLTGHLFIGTAEPSTDNAVYGVVSWSNPGSTAKTARTYASGFAALDLMAEGAVYLPPVSPKAVLGVTESLAANGSLTFPAPLCDIPDPAPDLNLAIGPRNKLTLPTGAANPRKTTLAVNATTGSYSGTFSLIDVDLLNPAKKVTRSASFSGLIVRDPLGGSQTGRGFFLLPQRPAAPGETATNTSILSGPALFSPME